MATLSTKVNSATDFIQDVAQIGFICEALGGFCMLKDESRPPGNITPKCI